MSSKTALQLPPGGGFVAGTYRVWFTDGTSRDFVLTASAIQFLHNHPKNAQTILVTGTKVPVGWALVLT